MQDNSRSRIPQENNQGWLATVINYLPNPWMPRTISSCTASTKGYEDSVTKAGSHPHHLPSSLFRRLDSVESSDTDVCTSDTVVADYKYLCDKDSVKMDGGGNPDQWPPAQAQSFYHPRSLSSAISRAAPFSWSSSGPSQSAFLHKQDGGRDLQQQQKYVHIVTTDHTMVDHDEDFKQQGAGGSEAWNGFQSVYDVCSQSYKHVSVFRENDFQLPASFQHQYYPSYNVSNPVGSTGRGNRRNSRSSSSSCSDSTAADSGRVGAAGSTICYDSMYGCEWDAAAAYASLQLPATGKYPSDELLGLASDMLVQYVCDRTKPSTYRLAGETLAKSKLNPNAKEFTPKTPSSIVSPNSSFIASPNSSSTCSPEAPPSESYAKSTTTPDLLQSLSKETNQFGDDSSCNGTEQDDCYTTKSSIRHSSLTESGLSFQSEASVGKTGSSHICNNGHFPIDLSASDAANSSRDEEGEELETLDIEERDDESTGGVAITGRRKGFPHRLSSSSLSSSVASTATRSFSECSVRSLSECSEDSAIQFCAVDAITRTCDNFEDMESNESDEDEEEEDDYSDGEWEESSAQDFPEEFQAPLCITNLGTSLSLCSSSQVMGVLSTRTLIICTTSSSSSCSPPRTPLAREAETESKGRTLEEINKKWRQEVEEEESGGKYFMKEEVGEGDNQRPVSHHRSVRFDPKDEVILEPENLQMDLRDYRKSDVERRRADKERMEKLMAAVFSPSHRQSVYNTLYRQHGTDTDKSGHLQ